MRRWRVPAAGALAALVLVAGYFMVLHGPRGERIAERNAETESLRAQHPPLRRSIQALEDVEAREPEFVAALGRLEELIPPRLAQPSLLVEMQRNADIAGVDLVSVTFGESSPPEGAPESPVPDTVVVAMPLTVIVNGPFGGITEMLRRIEAENDRAVLLGGVALTEGDGGFPSLTGTWSGQAYALLARTDPLLIDPNAPAAAPGATTTPPQEGP